MAKTIKIYDHLTQDQKKNWLTLAQVSDCHHRRLAIPKRLNEVDRIKSIKKQHMAIQSTEYAYHLKNGKGEFYGVEYDVEKFYNRQDVEKWVNSRDFDLSYERIRPVMKGEKERKDFRSYLNDLRNLDAPTDEGIVKFYGEDVKGLKDYNKSTQYRMYYAMFMNTPLIRATTVKLHNINKNTLDILVFLYIYKFFTAMELYHFYNITNHFILDGVRVRGINKIFNLLADHDFIKRVTQSNKSMVKYHTKTRKKILYTTTEKTNKIVKDYMDAMIYKRKVPYLGSTRNGHRLTSYDVQYNYFLDNIVKGLHSPNPYIFYEYCYDYINYKAEVELFDGDMVEFMKKSESAEMYFNPMVYKIAQKKYVKSSGEDDNAKYIDTFLSNRRWGHKV